MKILFLIRSLGTGGTELQLSILAKGLHELGHDVKVIVFYGGGALEADFREARVPIIHLNKKNRYDVIGFFRHLVHFVECERPDMLHSYLGVSNILAVLLKPFLPHVKVGWGGRASDVELDCYDWLARVSFWFECKLSRFADLVICNSYAGIEYARRQGFVNDKMIVIPNGIDTARFISDIESGKRLRKKWGIADDKFVIGIVGRLDPMKDHPTFLKAAALFVKERENVHFACIGDGLEPYKSELKKLAGELGLNDRIIWTGPISDMPAAYNALDINTSSSISEGFSNVIGEAMACGIPCAVTDVGDSAMIVGITGVVFPPKSPDLLAEGWRNVLARLGEKDTIAQQSRELIVNHYSIEKLVFRTCDAVTALLNVKGN